MSVETDTDDDVELFEIAHKSDLDGIELSQGSVRLESINRTQEFCLADHDAGYTIYFSGVRPRNTGGWTFLFERDDHHAQVRSHSSRSFPSAIDAVLGRIAALSDESSDSVEREDVASPHDLTEDE